MQEAYEFLLWRLWIGKYLEDVNQAAIRILQAYYCMKI